MRAHDRDGVAVRRRLFLLPWLDDVERKSELLENRAPLW
jgi:hypothetical protein